MIGVGEMVKSSIRNRAEMLTWYRTSDLPQSKYQVTFPPGFFLGGSCSSLDGSMSELCKVATQERYWHHNRISYIMFETGPHPLAGK